MSDQVTLVTSTDEVIGFMDKVAAHRGDARLHRAISIFLFRKNSDGQVELLIQQRSREKIVGAHQWANTACGNVWPNESYEACARRRLQAELGIGSTPIEAHSDQTEVTLQPIEKFEYQVRCNDEFSEHELDQVFAGWYNGKVTPNPQEVQATDWIDWETFKNDVITSAGTRDWAPWVKIIIQNHRDIVHKLDQFVTQKDE